MITRKFPLETGDNRGELRSLQKDGWLRLLNKCREACLARSYTRLSRGADIRSGDAGPRQ